MNEEFIIRRGNKGVRRAFKDMICSSKESGDLVCGFYNVAEALRGECTENIQFCILVQSEDPADQVFCRLIEAYCWENGIKTIKVDCGVTLTAMIDETLEEVFRSVLVMKPDQREETVPVLSLLHFIKHTTILKIG